MKKGTIVILVCALVFTSCKLFRPNEIFLMEKDHPVTDFKPLEKEYKLKPYDLFTLQIYTNDGIRLIETSTAQNQNNQNTLTYLIEFDGTAKLPTLGKIKMDGYTIREAETFLEQEFSKFYQKPFVKINVTNRRVIIFKSGSSSATVLPVQNENFTLIEALASCGGLDENAKAFKIKLIRGNLNNPEIYYYNIRTLRDMEKANFVLQANDIVYVETRPRYASRVLTEIAPYLSLMTTMLLVLTLLK